MQRGRLFVLILAPAVAQIIKVGHVDANANGPQCSLLVDVEANLVFSKSCSRCYKAAPCFGLEQRPSDGFPVRPKHDRGCGCIERGRAPDETCSGELAHCARGVIDDECLRCLGLKVGDVPTSWRQPKTGDVPALGKLPPVILIPPVGGSKLEASLSRKDSVSPFCKLEGDDNVWFDMANFIPGLMDCWEEEMRLSIDANASLLSGEQIEAEPDGVNVHTTNYGDPRESLAELGGKTLFDGVIDQLHHLGYRDNYNLFAAPFDWRRGPGHWVNNDWKKLRSFVEQTVQKAGGTPAVFVSASFGGTYFTSFLLHAHDVDEQWKQIHVASLVALSSPFAGAPAALGALLWGAPLPSVDGLGGGIDLGDFLSFLPRATVKSLVNTWATAFWLLPQEIEEEPLVALPPSWGANLTLGLLRDMWQMTGRTKELALLDLGTRYRAMTHPGVKVYCFFGKGTPSPRLYGYGPVTTAATQETPTEVGAESLASMFSSTFAGLAGNVAATTPDAPTRPPPGSSVGDAAWLHSAALLFEARMPDTVEAVSGDGLVDARSLAVCERWAVDAPELPAPTIVQVEGMKHGFDLFDRGVLRQFGHLLDKAIKYNPRKSRVPVSAARPPTRDPEAMQGDRRRRGRRPSTAQEGEIRQRSCSDTLPGKGVCPSLSRGDHCSTAARFGHLTRNSTCCTDLQALEGCMGSDCFPEFAKQLMTTYVLEVGPFADTAAATSYFAVWSSNCGGGLFPSASELLAYYRDAVSKGGGLTSKEGASAVAVADKSTAEIASDVAAPQTPEKSPRAPPTSQIIEGVWWSARTVGVAGAVLVAGVACTFAALSRTSSKQSVALDSEQAVPLQDLGDFLAGSEMPSERPGAFPSWSLSTHDEAYQTLAA